MSELVAAGGLGLGLGVVTGLPLGVINVVIVERAARARREAIGIGLGGAVADGVHAALAFAGLAAALLSRPALARGLSVASGVLLLAAAVTIARGGAPSASARRSGPAASSLGRGLALGLSLTLPNPAALAAWLAVAAALPASSTATALVTAAGVALGSAAWFTALAALAARGRSTPLTGPWPRRLAIAVLVLVAILAFARALA